MRKIILLALFFITIQFGFGNNGEDLGGNWKPSTYSITKTVEEKKIGPTEVLLTITFKCPEDNCALKGINFSMNGDKQIDIKKLSSKGVFTHKFKEGDFLIQFWGKSLETCITDTIKFKGQTRVYMTVNFVLRQRMVTRKPVIYLYPEKTKDISIQLNYKGQLDFTYPTYNSGWNVTANPDGTIESDGKKYNYLFWDGKMDWHDLNVDLYEGSVVKSENLVSFLETNLTNIGLNTREIQDFITYWAPEMLVNEENYIHFMLTRDYDQVATINVSPHPDSQLRVFMLWTNCKKDITPPLTPQTFPHFERNKFTLVEWGGSELTNLFSKTHN